MLPEAIREHLASEYQLMVLSSTYCSGGDINEARRLDTPNGQLFIKWNLNSIQGMFSAEAKGLALLSSANVLKVPEVIAVHEADENAPAYLLLEWLESGHETANSQNQLGEQLAALHQCIVPQHGLDHDNFIGSLPQYNHQCISWVEFWGQRRLLPQVELARQKGLLSKQREQRLMWLIQHLERFIPDEVASSLLHGDLWRGNVMVLWDGSPAVIDPAVYYGHFEVELAFTELFGGFSRGFYQAYWANTSFERYGYEQRRGIYQLYPLLVHLNLFGQSYGRRIDATMDQLGIA
ncbi:MAG: hypothetical protein CUN55_01710 [Phototrophicales bacterium]|nr:MAG: hypothetical protein CUN55_01710 [Phototrophicales bacterium]